VIDIHCHLLPGIDDGPDRLEESLELCQIAVADGITHAVVTPHIHPGRWDNTRQSIDAAVNELRRALADMGIPLQLGFAAEVRLSDEVIAQVRENTIPFYGQVDGYRVMLLEFPHSHIVPGSEKLTSWLLDNGVRPLIAHPERNKQVMGDVSRLRPFIESGCWLQLTAGSVTGNFGAKAQAIAMQLLDDDAVAVLASDAHNTGARAPALKHTYDYIVRGYGKDRANRLLVNTPAAIVADQFPDSLGFTSIADAV
jgi:protein-tyrosine phosphatase